MKIKVKDWKVWAKMSRIFKDKKKELDKYKGRRWKYGRNQDRRDDG